MEKRLYRSRRDRMLGGVCAGLAEYFDADVTVVRLAAVLLAAVTGGAAVIAYVVLWAIVPEEPMEGSTEMSDVTPVPAPEPAPGAEQPAEAAAPTYSAPTYTPPETPAPPQPQPVAPPMPQPMPQPVTGDRPRGDGRRGGMLGGAILIVLGAIFLVNQFLPQFGIDRLWPLILIVIGVAIILRRR